MISSARRTVASRWAMITEVRPRSSRSRARSIWISVGRSMFDVASSRIRMRGIGQQRPRDRDQLPLAGGQAAAALAHLVVEPAVQPRGDPVDADRCRRLAHLLVGRVGPREADVVGDGAREQERVLEHDAQLAPVAAQLHVAQVDGRPPAPRRATGRRSARSAWPASTCRRRTVRPAPGSRPPRRRRQRRAAPRCLRRRSGWRRVAARPRSAASAGRPAGPRCPRSASSTELILIMAAPADCTWPYTSDSSCSGWNTSCSR